jgi:hypothetical protein
MKQLASFLRPLAAWTQTQHHIDPAALVGGPGWGAEDPRASDNYPDAEGRNEVLPIRPERT